MYAIVCSRSRGGKGGFWPFVSIKIQSWDTGRSLQFPWWNLGIETTKKIMFGTRAGHNSTGTLARVSVRSTFCNVVIFSDVYCKIQLAVTVEPHHPRGLIQYFWRAGTVFWWSTVYIRFVNNVTTMRRLVPATSFYNNCNACMCFVASQLEWSFSVVQVSVP